MKSKFNLKKGSSWDKSTRRKIFIIQFLEERQKREERYIMKMDIIEFDLIYYAIIWFIPYCDRLGFNMSNL